MNPFQLSGPLFLALYLPLLVLGFLLMAAIFRYLGPRLQIYGILRDPYQVAMVAGGRHLAVMSALAALAHRGAVRVAANRIWRVESLQAPNHPLEKALLEAADGDLGIEGRFVRDYRSVDLWAGNAEQALIARGLLYGSNLTTQQGWVIGIVALPLLAFGVTKLLYALASNHGNVIFLVLAMLAFALSLAALPLMRGRRPAGIAPALGRARDLFRGLRDKVRSGFAVIEPEDVAYAIALFGRAEITPARSPQAFAALALAYPPEDRLPASEIAAIAATSGSSNCGSLSGSSCGSSSCGSSCGGGCGGGCGGCGS